MSSTWFDDGESYDDALDDGESYDDALDDGEGDDEASRSRRDRRTAAARARQRRVMLARQRRAQASTRGRPSGAGRPGRSVAVPPQAAAAIRTLDLQSKVQEDSFRSALAARDKRMSRSEYAAVVGAATNQFIESFDAPDNPYAKAALRFAPLLLLSPQKRGTGLEGVLKDPRFIGALAVGGITFLGEGRNTLKKATSVVSRVDVLSSSQLQVLAEDKFLVDAFNARGELLTAAKVEWSSDDPSVAEIDRATGKVVAKRPGTAVITVTVDGVARRVRLRVDRAGGAVGAAPAAGGGPGGGGPADPAPAGGGPGGGGPTDPAAKGGGQA